MASQSIKLLVNGELEGKGQNLLEDRRFGAGLSAALRQGVRLEGTRGGGTGQQTLEADPDDVLELTLEDGLVVYTSAARFEEDFLAGRIARSGEGGIVIPSRLGSGEASRGLIGFLLERIGIVDVETPAAETIADFIKDKIESVIVGASDALYSVSDLRQVESAGSEGLRPRTGESFNLDKPILVFIHGTASSTSGSFGDLWGSRPEQLWRDISMLYPAENIVGFEHHTLSLSPIENTINLLKALPKGARLHLVSHSRGGIVGELLCRGQLADGRDAFTDDDLNFFSRDKNKGLQSLIDAISAANGGKGEPDPYALQRQQLGELNGLFREKGITVERFVRVACPARGTTLASNRLDMYLSALLNIIGFIPVLKASPVYGLVKSLLLAVVKQKSRAEQIPGLEAQMPGSPTMQMLNNSRGSSLAPLAVIEGDIQPKGIFKKIALLLVDRFYEGDHDLVVNTPSMDGGTVRRFGIYAKSFKGDAVNHFSYFANDDSRAALLTGLREQRPSGFVERVQQPKVIARSLPRGRTSGEVPAVFIIPGILGSELAVGGDSVWVDMSRLIWGGFGKLDIGNREVAPVKPLAQSYGALADFLSESHEVIPFAYDWRKSIAHAADQLGTEVEKYLQGSAQPVRFIAHSMGGLVVRAMIARHPQLWDAICRRPQSRVLMLGTPNDGSHSMVRVLLGQEKLIKYLAMADLVHSHGELIDIIRQFPGVLELLPRESSRPPGEVRGFYTSAFWNGVATAAGKDWQVPTGQALREAERFWKEISDTPLDTQRVFYIAGRADDTPVDVVVEAGKIRVMSTSRGDGRVPWEGGIPQGVQHWYLDAPHGDLANYPAGFRGILEIIEGGGTLAFSGRPPVSRGVEPEREMPADSADYLPDEERLIRAAMGSAGPRAAPVTGLPQVQVSVVHGDLRFVGLPVAVGHYQGDEIVSAEAVLDGLLTGRLRRRYNLGLYPGAAGTHEIVINHAAGGLVGAIVVGLGDVGGLTPGMLTSGVRCAVADYALKVTEDQAVPPKGIEFASLLIGSGSGGISMENVLSAIIQGVLEANEKLAGDNQNSDYLIRGIRFVELFEDRASLAQHLLNQIAGNARYEKCIQATRQLQSMEGGRRRIYAMEQDGWWPRIRIENGGSGTLSFTIIDQGARVPMVITQTQRCSVEPFLRDATGSINTDDKVGRVLFELLIPPEFKHHAPERRDLVLVVDEHSAIYPWELLEYPTPDGDRALASEASVIRQLALPGQNPGMANLRGRLVVIADPDISGSGYPQLQGAEREGKAVASLFAEKPWAERFSPLELTGKRGADIVRVLMTQQIRVLHVSAHGVVRQPVRCAGDESPQEMTGVLIGQDHILTAAEIGQMPSVPQLAFINCCHLGKTGGSVETGLDRPNLLAADFGVSLIQRGIRAVVVAGWAVQDDAAEVFARTFYSQMLQGRDFGKAVKEARIKTQGVFPQFNTWGAYQCYGDPGFRLVDDANGDDSTESKHWNFISKSHCRIEIDNITAQAKTAEQAGPLRDKLQSLVDDLPQEWLNDATLQGALGRAWGELRAFSKAIPAYEAGAAGEKPAISIGDLEQLANLRVRHAIALETDGEASSARKDLEKAIASLNQLNSDFGKTIERMNLLGSAYKRQALLSGPATQARVKSLQAACRSYEEANELSLQRQAGRPNPYPVLNLLALRYLLVNYYGGDYSLDESLVERWRGALADHYDPGLEVSRERFWDAITGNELRFTEQLMADALDEDEATKIASRYQEIRRVAASPRQFSSVIEQLQLLRRLAAEAPLAPQKGSKRESASRRARLVGAIGAIIDQLSA